MSLGHALDLIESVSLHSRAVSRDFIQLFLDDVWKPFADAGMPEDQWDDDRLQRVGAADLGRDQRRHLYAGGFLDGAHGAVAFAAFLDLLDADHRRADAADLADPGIVGQGVERHDADAGALAHQLAGAQHADIGIAAAAGAEQCRADRQRQQVGSP